jgi:hypothetical protein
MRAARLRLRGVSGITPVAALAAAALLAAGIPFWGATASSPVDSDPATLKPGQFIWDAGAAPSGPIVVLVSLPEQRATVYRNGIRIGIAAVSTGKPGHLTPTGVFTILNKDADHRSKNYNNAPMPYSERLTWDGIALHAGGLPGFPSSHGCVHLPTRFAQLLFGITEVGMTVVIANDASAPVEVSHPSFLQPVAEKSGADDVAPRLAPGEEWRWQPEKAPEGPISIVVSAADRRVLVWRDGIEVGRARLTIADPTVPLGTKAFVLQAGAAGAPGGQHSPSGLRWVGISLPGSAIAGRDLNDRSGVSAPPEFVDRIYAILTPGSTLYVTDASVLETTGTPLNVLNADPPSAS